MTLEPAASADVLSCRSMSLRTRVCYTTKRQEIQNVKKILYFGSSRMHIGGEGDFISSRIHH